MRIWELIYGGVLDILFPQKCVFCGKLLDGEPDICGKCRGAMEKFPELPPNTKPDGKSRLQFLDSFTAVWYYKGKVRDGILGLKFRYRVDYALPLGRSVAMKVLREQGTGFDAVTWAPVSALRRLRRGYDQSQLLARTVGKELGIPVRRLLKKQRHTPAQSRLTTEERRANVLGAYRFAGKQSVAGKRILLIDDVFTTGATAGECARVLLTAGAKSVSCAAVAAAPGHSDK